MVEEIRALKELLDMGAITQEEYDKKKTELLNIDVSAPAQASSKRESSSSKQSSSADYGSRLIFVWPWRDRNGGNCLH